jgi:hypothetical protein
MNRTSKGFAAIILTVFTGGLVAVAPAVANATSLPHGQFSASPTSVGASETTPVAARVSRNAVPSRATPPVAARVSRSAVPSGVARTSECCIGHTH